MSHRVTTKDHSFHHKDHSSLHGCHTQPCWPASHVTHRVLLDRVASGVVFWRPLFREFLLRNGCAVCLWFGRGLLDELKSFLLHEANLRFVFCWGCIVLCCSWHVTYAEDTFDTAWLYILRRTSSFILRSQGQQVMESFPTSNPFMMRPQPLANQNNAKWTNSCQLFRQTW